MNLHAMDDSRPGNARMIRAAWMLTIAAVPSGIAVTTSMYVAGSWSAEWLQRGVSYSVAAAIIGFMFSMFAFRLLSRTRPPVRFLISTLALNALGTTCLLVYALSLNSKWAPFGAVILPWLLLPASLSGQWVAYWLCCRHDARRFVGAALFGPGRSA